MRKSIFKITRWFWSECPPSYFTCFLALTFLALSFLLYKQKKQLNDERYF